MLNAIERLPYEGKYIIRVILIMSNLAFGDGKIMFSIFLLFLSSVISEVLKSTKDKSINIISMFSQIRISLNNNQSNDSIPIFVEFLTKILMKEVKLETPNIDVSEIETYINNNMKSIEKQLRHFASFDPSKHIISYSFAQNFKFIAEVQSKMKKQ